MIRILLYCITMGKFTLNTRILPTVSLPPYILDIINKHCWEKRISRSDLLDPVGLIRIKRAISRTDIDKNQ
jgi:hypothetical protein